MKDWTITFHRAESVWSTVVSARTYLAAKKIGLRIAKEPGNRGSVLKTISTIY